MACKRSAVRPRYSPQALKPRKGLSLFMPFTLYILYSESNDKYYVGSCADISIRLAQHNSGRNISTKSGAPWKIVFRGRSRDTGYSTKKRVRDKKKKSRRYIEWLINSAQ